jgi:hypothetical protein
MDTQVLQTSKSSKNSILVKYATEEKYNTTSSSWYTEITSNLTENVAQGPRYYYNNSDTEITTSSYSLPGTTADPEFFTFSVCFSITNPKCSNASFEFRKVEFMTEDSWAA